MSSPSLGTTIVRRIAKRESVDPLDLDEPLYHVVDVDALEELVNGTDGSDRGRGVTVSFRYHGYNVTVESGGEVSIAEVEAIPDTGSQSGATSD